MISPQGYLERYIKGKSAEEVRKKIRSCERTIAKMQRELTTTTGDEVVVQYGQATIMSMEREYLQQATDYLVSIGAEYTPSPRAKNDKEFNDKLDRIVSLEFGYGGFTGYDTYNFIFWGCNISITHTKHNPYMGNLAKFTVDKQDFLERLKEIHIGEWKKHYIDQYICDGTQWKLEVLFNDGTKNYSGGSNKFPFNFDMLENLITGYVK